MGDNGLARDSEQCARDPPGTHSGHLRRRDVGVRGFGGCRVVDERDGDSDDGLAAVYQAGFVPAGAGVCVKRCFGFDRALRR